MVKADYFTHDLKFRHTYRDQDGPVDVSGRYMTYDLADKAKNLLLANDERPKFIYLPFQAPHAPVSAPDWAKKRIKLVLSVSKTFFSNLNITKLTIGSFTLIPITVWTKRV